jgi:hypothetical protein
LPSKESAKNEVLLKNTSNMAAENTDIDQN